MNPATLGRLYREHHDPALRSLQRRFTAAPHRELVEEALQDAWTILAGRPDNYINPQSTRSWLYLVSFRRTLELAGRARGHVDLDAVTLTDHAPDTHALVISRDRVRELLAFITTDAPARSGAPARTTARRRAVAARLLGVKYRELAAMTGTSYTAINKQTNQGVKLARAATRYQETTT